MIAVEGEKGSDIRFVHSFYANCRGVWVKGEALSREGLLEEGSGFHVSSDRNERSALVCVSLCEVAGDGPALVEDKSVIVLS